MNKIKRLSLKSFLYTNEDKVRFYFSYSKKINKPIDLNEFLIVGYATTCFRSNRTGCILRNDITHLYFQKKSEKGKVSNWLYKAELAYFSNSVDLFFTKFKMSDEFEFYNNILKLVNDDINHFEGKENDRIITNNISRAKLSLKSVPAPIKVKMYKDDDNSDKEKELESLADKIRRLDKEILNMSGFESSAPEKSIRAELVTKYNNLKS